MRKKNVFLRWFFLLQFFCFTPLVYAYVQNVPENLIQETLSESYPTGFAPGKFEPSDFLLQWKKGSPGFRTQLVEGSIEWVRLTEILVLPRGRLQVTAPKGTQALLVSGGASLAFHDEGEQAVAELPAVLLNNPDNKILLRTTVGGREVEDQLVVKFHPQKDSLKSKVFFDASCSPFRLEGTLTTANPDQWAYIGCRVVTLEGPKEGANHLEMWMYWDGAIGTLKESGAKLEQARPMLTILRAQPKPGQLTVQSSDAEMKLKYRIANPKHQGSMVAGIGPYRYSFTTETAVTTAATIPLLTLYAGYTLTETLRLVGFNATAMNKRWFTDVGVYMVSQSIRTIDSHLIVNLLLGGHMIAFNSGAAVVARARLPQGIEMVYRDAFWRGYHMALGGFFYPPINQISYYNTWLRFGSGRFFGEFNYISWQEKGVDGFVKSTSVGVSVGFPLFQFL